MSARSTRTAYGSVAVLIHWTSAAAVILTFLLGWVAADIVSQPPPAGLLVAHVAMGVLVLVLTLLHIVWWVAADSFPDPHPGQPAWQQRSAQIVHVALYGLLLLMATSGIVTMLLSGAMPIILAGGAVPDFSGLGPRLAHGLMSRLLLVLLAVHVGAALYHQFVRRDRLLARMGIGRRA